MNSPASSYYIYRNDAQTGPFRADQILKRFSAKKQVADVYIRTEAMNEWVPLPIMLEAMCDGRRGGGVRLVMLSLLATIVGAAALWGASMLTAPPQAKPSAPTLPAKTAK